MTAAIVAVSVAAYLVGLILTARWWYARIRPYTEPLSCKYSHHRESGHSSMCYQRPGKLTSTSREALGYAFMLGAVWFIALLAFGAAAAVMGIGRVLIVSRVREMPEEIAAKVKRLETENDRLRRKVRLPAAVESEPVLVHAALAQGRAVDVVLVRGNEPDGAVRPGALLRLPRRGLRL